MGGGRPGEPHREGDSLNFLTQLPLGLLPGNGSRTWAEMDSQQPVFLAKALSSVRMWALLACCKFTGTLHPLPPAQGLEPANAGGARRPFL